MDHDPEESLESRRFSRYNSAVSSASKRWPLRTAVTAIGEFVDIDVGLDLEGLIEEEEAAVASLEDDDGAVVALGDGVTGTPDR